MANLSKTTQDHEEIRRWAEERGAHPACVRGTGGKGDIGLLRLDFPGYSGEQSLEQISWDEFFEKFDERNLALLYQEETAEGQKSNFNKLVSSETAEEVESGSHRKGRSNGASRGGKKSSSRSGGGSASKRSGSGNASKSAGKSAGRSGGAKKGAAKKSSGSKSAAKKTAGTRTSATKKSAPKKASAKKSASKSGSKSSASKKSGRRNSAKKSSSGRR